jgi:hypothetical protein
MTKACSVLIAILVLTFLIAFIELPVLYFSIMNDSPVYIMRY